MNPEAVLKILGGLRVLRFFPNDEAAMNAILRLCGSMCTSIEQVVWLVNRMTSGIYAEWPGPLEMRACLCSRHKPKDGINAYSSVYPDGLPPDPKSPRRIAAPELKALPRGEPMTADPELQARIEKLAKEKTMPAAAPLATEFAKMLREIETPPHLRQGPEQPVHLDFKPITAEDVERERAKLRKERV